MHWKSRQRWLLLAFVFLERWFPAEIPYVDGANSDYSKECDRLTCNTGEQCLNRKFWCDHSPCPAMTYCSKSKKESLKGPDTCESVICTTGYKCQIRVRDCEWNNNCKQRMARCISEREQEESPTTSCAAVACPLGHSCVLRETHCHRPPCKLTRTCAQTEAVKTWFGECKQMGCRSEHDCFLRRPPEICATPPCHHVPDCIALTYPGNEDEHCRGWICPAKQVCTARVEAPCKQRDNCHVARACQSANVSRGSQQPIDFLSPRTTLTDLEREEFLAEQRRLRNFLRPLPTSNFTKFMMRPSFDEISPDLDYSDDPTVTGKTKRVTEFPAGGPSAFGDSPWLTYLKRKAGAEAVQYWIEKARSNEGYEEFVEWLESVAGLLDADTYRLWLREIQLASLDIPEFQSWISPRNLAVHRSHRFGPNGLRSSQPDNVALASGVFPGSIGGVGRGHAKNHLESSQNAGMVFFGGAAGPGSQILDNRYGRQGFMEKQTESSPTSPPHLRLSNFNFNEPRGFDGFRRVLPPTIMPSVPSLPYLEIGNRGPEHGPLPSLPSLPSREYEDSVGGSSWNSWPSYYPLESASPLFSGFPTQMPYTTVYLNNYTRSNGNSDVQEQAVSRPQQPNYNSQKMRNSIPEKVTDKPNVWSQEGPGLQGKLATDNLTPIKTMVDKISGFHQLSQLKPNIVNLDQIGAASQNVDAESYHDLPNLLIYFPPPFNFFIYYSRNDTDNNNHTTVMPSFRSEKVEPEVNKLCNETDSSEDCLSKKMEKHKELDYIRKIIMQLLDYWDKEEKILEHSNETMKLMNFQPYANNDFMDFKSELLDDYKAKSVPSFSSFMEWLDKNAKNNPNFLKEKLHRKGPRAEHKSVDVLSSSKAPDISAYDNLRNSVPKKMRILVDVDKNPEMMKALLSKAKSSRPNKSNSHEYQVIVNLKDLIDQSDEGTIAKRLKKIATTQLHQNLTDDKKMPKTLWVFPIYNEEENETVINELDKIKNKRIKTSEELNTPGKLMNNYVKYRPKTHSQTEDHIPQFVTKHRPEDYSQTHHRKDQYKERVVDDENATKENESDYEDDDPNNESKDESSGEKELVK